MISTKKEGGVSTSRRQAVNTPPTSRVVPKPVPQSLVRDARTYQLDQLRRRYSPQEAASSQNGTTSLSFRLAPSDPDFPFDLDFLWCEVRVPAAYPAEPPALSVRNEDIPRGFAINIEKGWTRLVQERKGATLLALVNALDKNLENYLSEQKADTVKLVSFKDTRHLDAVEADGSTSRLNQQSATVQPSVKTPTKRPYGLEESITKDQIAEAKARRAQETRQLEARMGRLYLYQRSSDGVVYTLPIEPRRQAELPAGLQGVKSFQLIVPLLYPQQPLRILLNDAESQDAEPIEELFMRRAEGQRQMTLMSHINYLTQNLLALERQAQSNKKNEPPAAEDGTASLKLREGQDSSQATGGSRGHLRVIPRPPEWDAAEDYSGSSQDGSSGYSDGDEDDDDGAAIDAEPPPTLSPAAPAQIVERGTALTFPSVELHGIELLQVSILNISLKCDRCKTINEVTSLKDGVEKMGSCRKCAAPYAARYRQELVHQNSTRAGFLDVSGGVVADLLPSTFVPTCAQCSTPSQGLVSVRGETMTNVCRECHARFTFRIPDVKFLAYAPGSALHLPTSGPRRRAEKLGLHAGEPLPRRGACEHYRRSYRWFRFSCCSKVYPCDRCHDEAGAGGGDQQHVHEWANRMICGWCSREQNYNPESCSFCGRSVIGRKGTGFWEGGKGTRNKVLMRKNDRRKYKRIGAGEAAKRQD